MIKKLLLLSLLIISNFSFVDLSYWATNEVWETDIKDALLEITEDTNIIESTDDDWLTILTDIFIWIKDSLTSLIMLIAVWVFLYIWTKLLFARGNPEEFKKGMLHLVYAIIWIVVVSLAWAAVTLIAGINF
jgi:hypothetical protein